MNNFEKTLLILTEDYKFKLKIPKGYKVTVVKDKNDSGGWTNYSYDCRVWYNGMMISHTSGTSFNYPEQAKEYGIESAMIMAGIIPARDDFKARKEMGIL